MHSILEDVIELLQLERIDDNIFRGQSRDIGSAQVFGGQVVGQALSAAHHTVDGRRAHSLHAYFLRPGRYDLPIRFVVDRIRDGRTFTTRRVVAHQNGEAIFNMAASFARPEDGMSHQRPMPEVGPPDGLEEWSTLRAREWGMPDPSHFDNPIEIRVLDPRTAEDDGPHEPVRKLWIRPRGVIPDDPALHTAILVYATDRTLISTAVVEPGRVMGKDVMAASLDHAVWFHHPIRFDDWMLYTSQSPISHAARGLIFGSLYRRDGVQLASVAQEALIRLRRKKSSNA